MCTSIGSAPHPAQGQPLYTGFFYQVRVMLILSTVHSVHPKEGSLIVSWTDVTPLYGTERAHDLCLIYSETKIGE